MVVIKVLTVRTVDVALVAPAFVATGAVASATTARTSSGVFAVKVPEHVTRASATLRFRVSGPVMFAVTTAGSGAGVKNGTSPKISELSENVGKT